MQLHSIICKKTIRLGAVWRHSFNKWNTYQYSKSIYSLIFGDKVWPQCCSFAFALFGFKKNNNNNNGNAQHNSIESTYQAKQPCLHFVYCSNANASTCRSTVIDCGESPYAHIDICTLCPLGFRSHSHYTYQWCVFLFVCVCVCTVSNISDFCSTICCWI